jgi:hypothetical protein
VSTLERIECFVFHFDLVGVARAYVADPPGVLDRIRCFQRASRRYFTFSGPGSYVVTAADNIWCRVNVHQPGTPSLVFNFAGSVMREAVRAGFKSFFGAITRGIHESDPRDRTRVYSGESSELNEQHVDMLSEPHMRAAEAEKCSKRLNRDGRLPIEDSCVWVSEEVIGPSPIEGHAEYPDAAFEPSGGWFDLKELTSGTDAPWPFERSRFRAIVPRSERC